MSKRSLFLAVVCLFLLFTVSAYAVDGTVLINQASVTNAGGFPYKIMQSGSYKLSSNLFVTGTTDAIDINADNVSLDLNGFSIIGPITCTGRPASSCSGTSFGTGVLGASSKNAVVKNGTIFGMLIGITLNNSGLIEEMTITQCSALGIFVFDGIVRRNRVFSNGGTGINASGLIESNIVKFNAGEGIFTFDGLGIGSTVMGNSITGSGGDGLFAQSSIYGSNVFANNATDVVTGFRAISQNNNNCSGTSC